jgi:peptide deformylase
MVATVANVPKQKLKKPPFQVHRLGDKVLRQPAKRVSKVNDETRTLAQQMLQTMYSYDGIGLAAPQVGINKQLIVIDINPDQPEIPPLVLVNPEITERGGELCQGEEGCLSVPEVFMDVVRPDRVTVVYRDLDGRPQKLTTEGLLARVIQHEMDHLNGVMFVDRVQNAVSLSQNLAKQGFSIKDVRPLRD